MSSRERAEQLTGGTLLMNHLGSRLTARRPVLGLSSCTQACMTKSHQFVLFFHLTVLQVSGHRQRAATRSVTSSILYECHWWGPDCDWVCSFTNNGQGPVEHMWKGPAYLLQAQATLT
jgi:hypothetical protein